MAQWQRIYTDRHVELYKSKVLPGLVRSPGHLGETSLDGFDGESCHGLTILPTSIRSTIFLLSVSAPCFSLQPCQSEVPWCERWPEGGRARRR